MQVKMKLLLGLALIANVDAATIEFKFDTYKEVFEQCEIVKPNGRMLVNCAAPLYWVYFYNDPSGSPQGSKTPVTLRWSPCGLGTVNTIERKCHLGTLQNGVYGFQCDEYIPSAEPPAPRYPDLHCGHTIQWAE